MKTTKLTPYQRDVLSTNKGLKEYYKSLGGARSALLGYEGLPSSFKKLLLASKKDANYKALKSLVRVSKTGNYCPFYILQCLHKNAGSLKEAFAKNAKNTTLKKVA